MTRERPLVSIITPVYNSEEYLPQAIESVLRQTYANWELLLVDDCSSDSSAEIMADYARRDARIQCAYRAENGGAARARNDALALASGRYIAYLDADDLWLPHKLARQVEFMSNNNAAFSCCDYEKIERDGTPLHKIVRMPERITYEQLLRNTIIQTVGVIVDTSRVDRELLCMPDIRRGQDSATWLRLLRNGATFLGQNDVLAQYRRVPQSLSANKWRAMRRTWHIYRRVERLSVEKAICCMVGWAWNASRKRIYPGSALAKIFALKRVKRE